MNPAFAGFFLPVGSIISSEQPRSYRPTIFLLSAVSASAALLQDAAPIRAREEAGGLFTLLQKGERLIITAFSCKIKIRIVRGAGLSILGFSLLSFIEGQGGEVN
jgi:hypothetical protein